MSDLGINMSDFSNTENLPNSLKELKEKCLDYSVEMKLPSLI